MFYFLTNNLENLVLASRCMVAMWWPVLCSCLAQTRRRKASRSNSRKNCTRDFKRYSHSCTARMGLLVTTESGKEPESLTETDQAIQKHEMKTVLFYVVWCFLRKGPTTYLRLLNDTATVQLFRPMPKVGCTYAQANAWAIPKNLPTRHSDSWKNPHERQIGTDLEAYAETNWDTILLGSRSKRFTLSKMDSWTKMKKNRWHAKREENNSIKEPLKSSD